MNLLLRRVGRQARLWVVFELKLGPDDEVHNVCVDTVGPVVVQDRDIV